MSTFHVISFGENARHTRFVAGKIERGQALCNRFSVEVFHESHVGSGVGWDLYLFCFCFHGVLYVGIDLRVRLSIRRRCAGGKCPLPGIRVVVWILY